MVICPIPKSTKKRCDTRERGSTAIITSSPYKNELESELKEKEEKLESRKKRLQKISEVKRNLTTPSAKGKSRLTSTSNAAKEKSKLILSQNMKRPQQQESSSESELSDNDDDPECILCGETYLCFHKDDGWIQCSKCKKWAHEACAGVDENDADFYICDCCV
ncbi:hypothetical protein JTB14_012284 [Gonioctena quinquepunctata]|nr:hypothetical protein JTB14_012284 [Gonioctena quinquepunctata]